MRYGRIAGWMVALALVSGGWGGSAAEGDAAKRDEVASGRRTEARADWWGFDAADATDALQNAFNSGAKKLVVPKMASPWLLHRTVFLPSDMEIVFEPGCEIQAAPGAFKGVREPLVVAASRNNLVLSGEGAVFRMRKADYLDPANGYEKSEWRHTLSLLSCENVRVSGLSFIASGGDGIYIGRDGIYGGAGRQLDGDAPGYCKDIILENVLCDDNHRQGLSVISAENLLVRDSRFNNTRGTAPMAGIDFEPNRPDERLVNCVVENCVMEGNFAYGFTALINLGADAPPVSLTVRNCRITGGGKGISIICTNRRQNQRLAGGEVRFVDCVVDGTGNSGIDLANFRDDIFRVVFERCVLRNTSRDVPSKSAIFFNADPEKTGPVGNVEFIDCTVADPVDRPVMAFSNLSPVAVMKDVTGALTHNGRAVDVAGYVVEKGFDRIAKLESLPIDQAMLLPGGGTGFEPQRGKTARVTMRRAFDLYVYAKAGEKVKVELNYARISARIKADKLKAKRIAPSGKEEALPDGALDETTTYEVGGDEGGYWRLALDPQGHKLNITACDAPYALGADGYLALYRPQGQLYFTVPAGVKDFAVDVSGEGAETVDVAVLDPKGKVVAERIGVSARDVIEIAREDAGEAVWSVRFAKAVEDMRFKLPAPLRFLVAPTPKEAPRSADGHVN